MSLFSVCLRGKKKNPQPNVPSARMSLFVSQHFIKDVSVMFCGCNMTLNVNSEASDSPLLTQYCSFVIHGMLLWIRSSMACNLQAIFRRFYHLKHVSGAWYSELIPFCNKFTQQSIAYTVEGDVLGCCYACYLIVQNRRLFDT